MENDVNTTELFLFKYLLKEYIKENVQHVDNTQLIEVCIPDSYFKVNGLDKGKLVKALYHASYLSYLDIRYYSGNCCRYVIDWYEFSKEV